MPEFKDQVEALYLLAPDGLQTRLGEEGGGITHGMIAGRGAIQGFEIDHTSGEPKVETIGGEEPAGICGSDMGIFVGKHPRAQAPLVMASAAPSGSPAPVMMITTGREGS